MTGAASRNRGARAERAVVNYLRTWWPDARRVLAGDGRQDCDVTFHPRVSLEVKDVAGSSWPSWCRQAVAQSKPGTIPMVVRRARGVTDVGRWVVRLPVGDLPVSGAYCPMPGVDGVWVETSLAHVVHVLLVEDGPAGGGVGDVATRGDAVMGTRNVDLICRRCGASASLPLGMSCDNHLPVPTPPDGWLLCLTCKGAGEVAEYHDYATEWLGCQDCMGLGSIRCEAEGHWFHGPDGTEHDPDEGPCEYPGELTGEPR